MIDTLVMVTDKKSDYCNCNSSAAVCFLFYFILFDDIPTKYEQKSRKKREWEITPYKRNVSVKYLTLTTVPVPQWVLDDLLLDPDIAYIKNIHTFMLGNFSSWKIAWKNWLNDHGYRRMQWPNQQCREELANQYTGIFHGCIGIADIKILSSRIQWKSATHGVVRKR